MFDRVPNHHDDAQEALTQEPNGILIVNATHGIAQKTIVTRTQEVPDGLLAHRQHWGAPWSCVREDPRALRLLWATAPKLGQFQEVATRDWSRLATRLLVPRRPMGEEATEGIHRMRKKGGLAMVPSTF